MKTRAIVSGVKVESIKKEKAKTHIQLKWVILTLFSASVATSFQDVDENAYVNNALLSSN